MHGGTTDGPFEVNGFSSGPGQSRLTPVTCDGITKTEAASTYNYSLGLAEWKWTTAWGFSAHVGSQFACAIVHN